MLVAQVTARASDEAEAAIRPFFPSASFGGRGDGRPLSFELSAYSAAGLTLLDYTIGGRRVDATTDMPGFTVAENELEGEMTDGRDVIDAANPYSVPHIGMNARMDWVHCRAVQIDADAVQRFARVDLGDDAFEVRNLASAPLTPQAGTVWKTTARYLHDRMLDGSADTLLTGASLSQLLVGVYLTSFRTTWTDAGTGVAQTRSVSAAVRRAKLFVDEHVAQPIDVADIAQAARLSIRGLQVAFRRELGCTPMEYLRRARLDAVRTELLAADPTKGDTVSAVARRWGFVQLGRFASTYRATFGELPGDTLRA